VNLNFDTIEEVRNFIHNTDSGLYDGKNEDGAKVAVLIEQGVGMEVITYQGNGWIRVNEYDEYGHLEIETFKGRWDKDK